MKYNNRLFLSLLLSLWQRDKYLISFDRFQTNRQIDKQTDKLSRLYIKIHLACYRVNCFFLQ